MRKGNACPRGSIRMQCSQQGYRCLLNNEYIFKTSLFNLHFEPMQSLQGTSSPEGAGRFIGCPGRYSPSVSVVLYHQVWGSLGANAVSCIVAGTGISNLIINLKRSVASMDSCQRVYENDSCFMASFSTVGTS